MQTKSDSLSSFPRSKFIHYFPVVEGFARYTNVGCIFILYLSFETPAVLEPDLLDFK